MARFVSPLPYRVVGADPDTLDDRAIMARVAARIMARRDAWQGTPAESIAAIAGRLEFARWAHRTGRLTEWPAGGVTP